MKTCTVCNESKEETEFHFRSREKGTRMNQCKSCGNERARVSYRKNGGYEYAKTKKIRHGLTYEEFIARCEAQDWTCLICLRECDKLVVDHDHECCSGTYSCGKCIRGLICGDCNRGLGGFRDDTQSLLAAVDYLNNYARVV